MSPTDTKPIDSADKAAMVRDLVQSTSINDLIGLVNVAYNDNLATVEEAKDFPMKNVRMSDEDWATMCNHFKDGGGVINKVELGRGIINDILAGNQAEDFWDRLIHFVKATMKIDGFIQPVPDTEGLGTTAVKFPSVGLSKLQAQTFSDIFTKNQPKGDQ